ncbi:hypothetical protein AB0N89_00815 [Amycolatopsis sp. NPDC089917]|uniref:hypothetical protein n=1 Tax=Amycolatopsis sp. NPDC089917 TaxID=3155187 RepID=UPI00341E2100
MPDITSAPAALDPQSVLSPAEVAAAHAAADDAPAFTDDQRDRLRSIFGPAVHRLRTMAT